MTISINRTLLNVVGALAVSTVPLASAFAAGYADAAACALKQPIRLELHEIGTQLGLVFPDSVMSPPGAPPAAPGAGIASIMVGDLLVNGVKVGVTTGSCLTVGITQVAPGEPAGPIGMCNQTFNLWGLPAPYNNLQGRIMLNGPVNQGTFHGSPTVTGDGVPQTLSVVGGTGSFLAARGSLTVRESNYNEHVQVWDLSGLLCL